MSQLYSAPITSICSSNTTHNTIYINLTPYTAFTPTTSYILKTYTNGALTNTSSGAYSTETNQIVVNTDLSDQNVYAFQVQLLNNTQSSEFSVKNENIPVYPVGPTITSRSTITSTTVQVIYTTYSTTGATCIINVPGISYTNLTDTSVTLTGLTENTPYTSLTILFRKTIQGFVVDSSPSDVPSFTTNGSAPEVLSSDASSANNATLIFNNYSSATPGQFNFTSAIVTAPGATPTIVSITQPDTIYIGSLAAATTYNGCTLTLTASGARSDPSLAFTIKTLALAPTYLAFSSSTTTTINLTFTKPASLPLLQSAKAFHSNGEFNSVTLINQGEIRINGLYTGKTYTNVYITVSDSTYTSMPSETLSSISTLPSLAPTVTSTSAGADSVTIIYDTYTIPFTPTFGTLYNSSGSLLGTVSASSTQMSPVTGLSSNTLYTDSYITLTDGLNTSNRGTVPPFRTQEIPILRVYVSFNGGASLQLVFDDFTSFTPTVTYTKYYATRSDGSSPSQQYNATELNLGQGYMNVTFGGITGGRGYEECYMILSDGTNYSARSIPSNTSLGPTFSYFAANGGGDL